MHTLICCFHHDFRLFLLLLFLLLSSLLEPIPLLVSVHVGEDRRGSEVLQLAVEHELNELVRRTNNATGLPNALTAPDVIRYGKRHGWSEAEQNCAVHKVKRF